MYVTFMIKKEDVKNIMEKVKYDWDIVKTIEELNILKEYAKKGKFYINTFSLVTYSCLAVTWLTPFTNELLDLVKPLNESRARKLPILVELFIDQEKFHYPISFMFNLLLLMDCICIIAIIHVTTMWFQHVLSLFEIIRYTVDWYNAPLGVQKLILTMMIKYTSPISINMFGVYSPSMKGFLSLFKATWSYFMVLSSIQTRN
ncbi:uncharacterized protein LOC143305395 [Osmia lignaria lignaria]|uniref:uncharacterized protein LOC143305395 n=1 Tax=Osmia lignaria lignaria TaxID=1437193 RepID=UPI00402B37C7